jgi:hypothetical protein
MLIPFSVALIPKTISGGFPGTRVFQLRTTEAGKKRRRLATKIGQKIEALVLKPQSKSQRASLFESIELLTAWIYRYDVTESAGKQSGHSATQVREPQFCEHPA